MCTRLTAYLYSFAGHNALPSHRLNALFELRPVASRRPNALVEYRPVEVVYGRLVCQETRGEGGILKLLARDVTK